MYTPSIEEPLRLFPKTPSTCGERLQEDYAKIQRQMALSTSPKVRFGLGRRGDTRCFVARHSDSATRRSLRVMIYSNLCRDRPLPDATLL